MREASSPLRLAGIAPSTIRSVPPWRSSIVRTRVFSSERTRAVPMPARRASTIPSRALRTMFGEVGVSGTTASATIRSSTEFAVEAGLREATASCRFSAVESAMRAAISGSLAEALIRIRKEPSSTETLTSFARRAGVISRSRSPITSSST